MSGGGDPIKITNTENKVGALRVQSATQGMPVQIAYGLTRVSPNMAWYDDFTAIAHTTVTESGGGGGKGGGGGGVTTTDTTYTYTVACLLSLCEGPIGHSTEGSPQIVNRVWKGKEKPGLEFAEYQGSWSNATGQTPYGYIVTNHPEQALSYRNTAYLASGSLDLGSSTSIPNYSFEVFGLLDPSLCTPDVNPKDVLIDVLTAPNYSANFPSDYLDVLENFGNFCAASNFMCAPLYSSQRPAADIVKELCMIGNSAPVWSEGKLKVIPYGDETVAHTPNVYSNSGNCTLGAERTWIPDLTVQYDLTVDDFIADPGTDPVVVNRKRQSDAYNSVQVEILDRDNDYNVLVCSADDLGTVEQFGLRQADPVIMHSVCNANIGRAIAQAQLQRTLYVRNTYAFQVGWKFARLEPMDIVSLTEPTIPLDHYAVRITEVEEDEDGMLSIVAEDLSAGTGTPGSYATQPSSGVSIDTSIAPGDASAPVIFQPPVELSGVPQIWLGAAGGIYWGGAQVWVSDDDASYVQLGTLGSAARYGELTANFPAGGDPDTTHTLSVDFNISAATMTSATPAQADGNDTLSWLDGEIVAYSTAILTAPYTYDFTSYIRRGLRCSFEGNHLAGSKFMRLDGAVGKFGIASSRVGSTLYLKLVSFNIYGLGLQDLASVTPYTYVVQPLGIVAANGVLPDVITAEQVLCIPPATQMSIFGRMTVYGRINCDGRLIIN
jgi:hypothetical protein